ncbi:uncharacterized protein LOC132731549 [Ruditapes philippinarum]|uniref:uncharacterized protein LOC132731549 n=1 Tax=Ruditapes philippinarum TaxID=129788 RepID=UPI00295BDF6E|nr:uncharacterized protein LOC132731549 [Ruditapes philippinarum]
MKTFKSQAIALHRMCGAQVSLTVVAESGKKTTLSLPQVLSRHVKLQAGESSFSKHTRQMSSPPPPQSHSPKKTKVINHMPGKKTTGKKKHISIKERICNKLSVCFVIFNYKKDQLFKKKHGINAVWLGCDHDGCHY